MKQWFRHVPLTLPGLLDGDVRWRDLAFWIVFAGCWWYWGVARQATYALLVAMLVYLCIAVVADYFARKRSDE